MTSLQRLVHPLVALRHARLAFRMALGFGALVLIMIGVIGVAAWQARLMERQLNSITNAQVPRLVKIQALAHLVDELDIAANEAISATDDTASDAALVRIERGRSTVGQQIQDLQEALHGTGTRGEQAAAELGDQSSGILVALVKLSRVVKAHKMEMGHTVLADTVRPRIGALGAAVSRAQDVQMQLLEQARSDSAQASHIALLEIGTALACAVALASLLAWRLSRSVTIPVIDAVHLAERIAAGDLRESIKVDRFDEIGRLQQALVDMQSRLSGLVGDIGSVAGQMAVASSEIASGSSDLSRRTEQTASSLQSTASSMGQLTERVRLNADSARDANGLAATTAQAAQRGGDVVSRVVDNMNDISQANRRIADITGVIDGISFQTNILALNAAVEAARAGEHGRGFAVVASEVRALAHRAAAASGEIKSLIGSSVEKVDSGCRLVHVAGGTMHEIVDGVERMTAIIAGISRASVEQSGDLGRVNETVGRLDEMTQQNSALVEESAAAAESMREQSRRLQDMVNTFKISDT